jgi:hypothetical protein
MGCGGIEAFGLWQRRGFDSRKWRVVKLALRYLGLNWCLRSQVNHGNGPRRLRTPPTNKNRDTAVQDASQHC